MRSRASDASSMDSAAVRDVAAVGRRRRAWLVVLALVLALCVVEPILAFLLAPIVSLGVLVWAVRARRPSPLPAASKGGRRDAAAGLLLVLSVPVASWWLVGDQSTTDPASADYLFRPLPLSATEELIAGAASVLVGLLAAAALLRPGSTLRTRPSWRSVLALMLVAGVLAGLGWRVLTAGVIGAPIGGGLYLFQVCPAIGVLVLSAAVRGARLVAWARQDDRRGVPRTGARS